MLIMLTGLVAGCFKDAFSILSHLSNDPHEAVRFGTDLILFTGATESNAAHFALPIAAAIPCSYLFIEDMTSGFVKSYLPRTGRNNYVAVRCITSIVCSAFSVMLGLIAFRLLLIALFAPISSPQEEDFSIWFLLLPLLRQLSLYGSAAAVWAGVGLLISSFTMNRFSAVASPFILFYLFEILVSQYFPKVFRLMPSLYLIEYGAYEKALLPAAVSLFTATVLHSLFAAAASVRVRRQI